MAFGGLKGSLTGNAASITNPIDATGSVVVVVGDLIFGVIGEQTTLTATTVTDNLGNSYSATNAGTDAGTSTGRAYFSRVTVAGTLTAVHFAASASTDNVAVQVSVIEGPFKISPLDANPANITTDIASPFTCPPTGTISVSTSVVMAWGVATGSTVWAATSPNLLDGQAATAAILHTVIGHKVVTSSATSSPEFTAASNPTDAVLGTSVFLPDISQGQPSDKGWGNNPRGYPYPISNRDGNTGNLGITARNIPVGLDTTHILRDPLITKYEKQNYQIAIRSQADQVDSNTTLPIATAPTPAPSPFDWPNPKGPVNTVGYKTQFEQVDSNTTLPLQTPVVLAPSPTAWDNPRGPVNSVGYKSQTEQVNTNTLLPIPVPPAAPGRPIEWPVPKGYTPSILLKTWVANYTLLYQTAFRQLDWPNPKGPLQFNRTYEFSVNLNLIGQDQTFGLGGYPNFDWPNPKGPVNTVGYKSQAEQVNTNTLLPIPAVVAPPFKQTDWQNPLGPKQYNRSGEYREPLTLTAPGVLPPRQTDWPNPRGYTPSIELKTWTVQLQNTTLAPLSGDTTHTIRGPLITKYEKRLELHQAVLAQPIIDTVNILRSIKPFYQNDWPVPKGSYYYQKEFFQTPIVILPTPDAPLKAANWPNPVLRTEPVIDHKTHSIQNILITLLPPITPTIFRAPFKFRPWRVDSRVAENTTPLQNTISILTATAPQIPNRPIEWPNPRGPLDNIALRSYIYSPNIFLIGQDTFYGDPGEVPGFTWPQPRTIGPFQARGYSQGSAFNIVTSPTIKPVGSAVLPDKLYAKAFNERTWLVNLQQSTLHFTPVLLFFNTKLWVWNGKAELLNFNVPVASKSWVWQSQAPIEKQTFSFQKAWNWSGKAFGANLVVTPALKAWNWVTNTFSLAQTIQFVSKSWQWRGNPVTIIGTGLTSSIRKLLMLLGVGH